MADPASVSLVIPAYNEAASIGDLVDRARALGAWHEIIVVDDGSADDTGARADGGRRDVVRHPYNKGNGAAVKSGIRRATGEYVLIIDADGQHPPRGRLADRLARSASTTWSSARAPARRRPRRPRRSGNAALNWLASYLTGRDIPDLTSGFRGARRAHLQEFLHLLPNGFSTPTTTTLAFIKAGLQRRVRADRRAPARRATRTSISPATARSS